ncbi:MAG: aldo/keto reductase [Chloroflexi bacterium]|nr:aldo/keto reductase [Chloroflexota bacterium]
MEYRTLGRTGLKVSVLGYGTGGAGHFGARNGLTAADRQAFVRRALDLGVNFFDTAGGYGDSETYLGETLAGAPRDSYVLETKWDGGRWLAQGGITLTESVERSLVRMRTDHIDVFLFHMIDVPVYETHRDRFYPEVALLKEQGKVRHIGFTQTIKREPRFEGVMKALTGDPDLWDVVMLKYGIMNQWAAKETLPLAKKHDIGIVNMAVVRTTLTNPAALRQRLDQWRTDGTIAPDALPGDDPFDWLAHGDVGSVAEAAYRFAAAQEPMSTVLTGTSNIAHLELNVAALERGPLPEVDARRLVELLGGSWSPD